MLGEKLSDLRLEYDLKDCDELGMKHGYLSRLVRIGIEKKIVTEYKSYKA